jgi:hypothetical protein
MAKDDKDKIKKLIDLGKERNKSIKKTNDISWINRFHSQLISLSKIC